MVKIKSIILSAGYATRLYPLTKNRPKPLLDVGGKPIVEHIIKKIEEVDEINEIFIVTNDKFYKNFLDWNNSFESSKKIVIINDKTASNENRLGSLGDIKFVIEHMNLMDDILVVAGDNLFEFSILDVVKLYRRKKKTIVALYDVKDLELAKHYGIVLVNEDNKIIHFEEKPKNPKSTLSSTGIYIFPYRIAVKIIEFVKEEDKKDKIGNFLEWLYKNKEVYCYISQKKWFDIGSLSQLEKARQEFHDNL